MTKVFGAIGLWVGAASIAALFICVAFLCFVSLDRMLRLTHAERMDYALENTFLRFEVEHLIWLNGIAGRADARATALPSTDNVISMNDFESWYQTEDRTYTEASIPELVQTLSELDRSCRRLQSAASRVHSPNLERGETEEGRRTIKEVLDGEIAPESERYRHLLMQARYSVSLQRSNDGIFLFHETRRTVWYAIAVTIIAGSLVLGLLGLTAYRSTARLLAKGKDPLRVPK